MYSAKKLFPRSKSPDTDTLLSDERIGWIHSWLMLHEPTGECGKILLYFEGSNRKIKNCKLDPDVAEVLLLEPLVETSFVLALQSFGWIGAGNYLIYQARKREFPSPSEYGGNFKKIYVSRPERTKEVLDIFLAYHPGQEISIDRLIEESGCPKASIRQILNDFVDCGALAVRLEPLHGVLRTGIRHYKLLDEDKAREHLCLVEERKLSYAS